MRKIVVMLAMLTQLLLSNEESVQYANKECFV